jgi:putative restriction endonuclease
MANAVFTTKVTPSYKDLPEFQYHFPRRYLDRAKQTVGDYIVYYEPRRSTSELSSSGGRQAYFAFARVTAIVEDRHIPDHYFAYVADYQDFASDVPFSEGSKYYESALQKDDGSTNRGAFGSAVRLLAPSEFDQILKAGYSPIIKEEGIATFDTAQNEISEPDVPFERPMVEVTVARPFREKSFMYNVRTAYTNRCAMTGLRLINGGGRPEVQAAHIQPVAAKGPDSVRNGLALSGTVHWMFDRGLVSVGDDYQILVAKNHVSDDAARLLNKTGAIYLPKDETLHPNARFLKFHRDNVFKG